MKTFIKIVLVLSLATVVGVGGFLLGVRHADKKPAPLTNNVLRWVKDPNLGTNYYGWYEADGSAFNCVGTSSYNKRMGNVEPTNVPVHMWQRVN